MIVSGIAAAAAADATADRRTWVSATLDAVADTLLRLQAEIPEDAHMSDVFQAVQPVLYRLADFEAMGFVSIDDDGLGFTVEALDDWSRRADVVGEVEHQVAEGTFAWALFQHCPVIARGDALAPWIVMHSLATPSRSLGMFVGALPADASYLPDAANKGLSIVMMSCASVIESGALIRSMADHSARLEDIVSERTLELRRSEEAARKATHAKGQFLASMSHEMRTPLNGVIGMASLLKTTHLDAEQREQVETIVRSSEHVVHLINDLLDSSKAEAGQLDLEDTWYDIREVLENVLELLAPRAAEKQVEMILDFEPALPHRMRGDPARVQQVITNLVGNATKFTSEGFIRVRAAHGETPGSVRIDVQDTGIGIEPENAKRIFEAYAQAEASTTRKFGGTGLGLSIARTLARMMDGDLSVTSAPGVGSTFTFDFAPPAQGQDEEVSRVLDGEVVLIVTARPELAEGLTATIARSGAETIASPVTRGADPVSAWLDAGWSGGPILVDCAWDASPYHALAKTVRSHAGLEDVVLVAMVPPSDRRSGELLVESGFDAWLPRPTRERRLVQALRVVDGEETAPDEVAALAPARILIADDNAVNLKVASKMVTTLGSEAVTVANGREAVEALREEDFDVVLMDCQMPVMDGYEATAAIRATGSVVPIIALTGADSVSDRERSLASGMNQHVAKPLTLEALRGALAMWIPEKEEEPVIHFEGAEADPAAPDPSSNGQDGESVPGLVVFDVEGALERTAGDRELLGEVIELFDDLWPEQLAELETAVAGRDGTQIAASAHRLKGAALNLGADRVADVAKRAEDAGKLGELDDTNALLDELRTRYAEFSSAAQEFMHGRVGA